MTRFRLDKWYFDCVSADGDVFIGYAATIEWGPARLRYGARMTATAEGAFRQRQSFAFGVIDRSADGVAWRNDPLGIRGRWTGGAPIADTVLVDGPDGSIEWGCLAANAAVELMLDGKVIRGTGYVEKISLTIPPWKLPFRELRWGRYVADDLDEHLVWIDMRDGAARGSWAWLNGVSQEAAEIGDDCVRVGGRELSFAGSRPVRCDNVATTLLGRFRFLSNALPRGLRGIEEEKRFSSCPLAGGEATHVGGSTIHEVVRWR